ncbi:hypothetical protein [Achromobacter phage Motura]|uniref:Uncharacterized protein n=1 Tax=Achromobacter phage Motura TaxID=2591403 RepID=A0A514CSP5_9CAUD|nr:hypothetical protein H1O15_gp309 [Achromobacter phage Motura]QDH83497.1 hypothetical protein [Achromobacter phage Motura]
MNKQSFLSRFGFSLLMCVLVGTASVVGIAVTDAKAKPKEDAKPYLGTHVGNVGYSSIELWTAQLPDGTNCVVTINASKNHGLVHKTAKDPGVSCDFSQSLKVQQ